MTLYVNPKPTPHCPVCGQAYRVERAPGADLNIAPARYRGEGAFQSVPIFVLLCACDEPERA